MNMNECTKKCLIPDGNIPGKFIRICKNLVGASGTDDNFEYCMDHPKMGKCLIFNHQHFLDPGDERKGTKGDADGLECCFKELGFDVVRFDDLKKSEVLEELQKAGKEDHGKSNCFVCCILTHGFPGLLCAADKPYDIDEVFAPFYDDVCESLVDKPKIFVIEACQGDQTDRGVIVTSKDSTDSMDELGYIIETHPDFLIAYGSVPGYYCWRYEIKGAWFIQALCDALHAHARDMDLLKLLTVVNRRVSYNYPLGKIYDMKQVPCITSTLIKEIKFPS